MSYRLPLIPYLRLKFLMRSEKDAVLPITKASMLRGAFGHAFRRTVCVMARDQSCESCMLKKQCAYTKIFETFVEGEPPPFLNGLKTSPRPFIIDACDLKTEYAAGDFLEFDVTLLGRACELHPYVIFAFALAAERGFARKRYSFQLERVDWHDKSWKLLYDGQKQCLCHTAIPTIGLKNSPLPSPLCLKFLTPTRLKVDNKLTMEFTFRVLVFKMLRRILELAYFHVPDARPDWNFHELLVKADEIKIAKNKLYWDDWQRYSNRQKSKLDMGGFFGEIVLEGDLEPFNDVLRMSEVVHVGKGTVFGLGKMRLESLSNPPVVPPGTGPGQAL